MQQAESRANFDNHFIPVHFSTKKIYRDRCRQAGQFFRSGRILPAAATYTMGINHPPFSVAFDATAENCCAEQSIRPGKRAGRLRPVRNVTASACLRTKKNPQEAAGGFLKKYGKSYW
jgi:hypothetical protein